MAPLVLSALLNSPPRWLAQLLRHWSEFVSGVEKARAMAMLYRDLAGMSDRELARRGLKRQDIPRAVVAAFNH
jgi:hypothetical protein